MNFSYKIYPSIEQLHELARSFDRDETHQFKLDVRTKNGRVKDVAYVHFFDVLVSFPTCDLKQIKKALEGASLLKRFTDSKSYLYHRLLDALRIAHSDKISDVFNIAAEMKVLIFKGLHHHIPILYKNGISFATATEDFEGALRLISLWKFVLLNQYEGDNLSAMLEEIASKEIEIRNQISNLQDWEDLNFRRFIAKGKPLQEKTEIVSSIRKHPLIINGGPCLSIKAKIRRLTLEENLLSISGLDHSGRIPILFELLNLIGENQDLLENILVVETYLYSAFNVGLLGIHFEDADTYQSALQYLSIFGEKHPSAEALVFERSMILKLSYSNGKRDTNLGIKTVSEAATGISKFGKRLSPKFQIELVLEIALHYFHAAKWSQIAKLTLPYLNDAPIVLNRKAVNMTWIFFILAQFEIENFDTMVSYAGYAKKYLKKHRLETEMGITLLNALSRIGKRALKGKQLSELSRFEMEVLPILEKPKNLYYEKRLPFREWITQNRSKRSSI